MTEFGWPEDSALDDTEPPLPGLGLGLGLGLELADDAREIHMPAPSPTFSTEHGAVECVKKQLKKALAGKVAAALPGIIGAIIS